MDDKVIEFVGRGEHASGQGAGGEGPEHGYAPVPGALVREIFYDMRFHDIFDFATFVVSRDGSCTTIARISMGDILDLMEEGELSAAEQFAVSNVPTLERASDIRCVSGDDGLSAVYALGDGAVYGVSYKDHGNSPKGLMMAALLLYAFAVVNLNVDRKLFLNAYAYLPFVPQIGLGYEFFADVDHMVEALR